MGKENSKISQLVQYKDETGMLKNTSELLQDSRDKNIDNLFLVHARKNENMRAFWHGGRKDIADFLLLLEQIKFDILSNGFREEIITRYGKEE